MRYFWSVLYVSAGAQGYTWRFAPSSSYLQFWNLIHEWHHEVQFLSRSNWRHSAATTEDSEAAAYGFHMMNNGSNNHASCHAYLTSLAVNNGAGDRLGRQPNVPPHLFWEPPPPYSQPQQEEGRVAIAGEGSVSDANSNNNVSGAATTSARVEEADAINHTEGGESSYSSYRLTRQQCE